MRQEPIYVNNDFVINRIINNYKTSSDLCFFTNPKIVIDNTEKIGSGVTINSNQVNVIEKGSPFSLNLDIIENNLILTNSATLNFNLLKRVKNNRRNQPLFLLLGGRTKNSDISWGTTRFL